MNEREAFAECAVVLRRLKRNQRIVEPIGLPIRLRSAPICRRDPPVQIQIRDGPSPDSPDRCSPTAGHWWRLDARRYATRSDGGIVVWLVRAILAVRQNRRSEAADSCQRDRSSDAMQPQTDAPCIRPLNGSDLPVVGCDFDCMRSAETCFEIGRQRSPVNRIGKFDSIAGIAG